MIAQLGTRLSLASPHPRPPTCFALHQMSDNVEIVAVLGGHLKEEGQLGRHNVRKVAAVLQKTLRDV